MKRSLMFVAVASLVLGSATLVASQPDVPVTIAAEASAIVVPVGPRIDGGDSQMCQDLPPSTGRRTFLRSDPVRGTGAFAGLSGGTVNLEGGGTRLGRTGVYRFDLELSGFITA